MRVTPPVTGLAVAALLAAWSGHPYALAADAPASAAREKPAEALVSSPSTEPRTTLLQAGAEPRKVLRFHPKAGDKRNSTMTLKMAMEVHVGDAEGQPMKMPIMTMVMDTTANNVTTEGDITYETVMTDVSVAEDSDATPQIVDAMKTALGGIKGLSINGTMSNRGITKQTQVKMPAGVTPQTQQMMEQMKDAFSNTGVAFPEEAVGLGAKWELKQQVKTQGMTVGQTTVYELVSLDGDRFKAKTTLTQTAANQQIQNPAMPGMKMDLVKLQSKGTGEVTGHLGQLMPGQATMDLHNESAMAMNTGDQKTDMSMKMDMNLRVETK